MQPNLPQHPLQARQGQLAQQIVNLVENVSAQRALENSRSGLKPSAGQAQPLIQQVARKNAAISGVVSFFSATPVLGFLTTTAELVLVLRNQFHLIHDLHFHLRGGQGIDPNRMAVLYLLSLGEGLGRKQPLALSEQALRLDSDKVNEQVALAIAARLILRIGRSMVCRFVPVLGAAAFAYWSAYETRKIGEFVLKVHQQDAFHKLDLDTLPGPTTIRFPERASETDLPFLAPLDEAGKGESEPGEAAAPLDPEAARLEKLKIEVLIELMKIDLQSHPTERQYLEQIINLCPLDELDKTSLRLDLDGPPRKDLDLTPLVGKDDHIVSLMVDMAVLAKKDGKTSLPERYHIEWVASKLGIDPAQVLNLLQ